ncbi:hypothetical protein H8E77_19785, partial [bacterium]|nr:hypothetical protein [bacterium]
MKICIFEENIDKIENLYPLTLTRPVFELKCGYTTLSERITRNFDATEVYFFLRDYLVPTFKNRTGANIIDENSLRADDFLFINGRWLMNKGELELDGPEEIGVCGEEVAYIRAKQETIKSCLAYTQEEFYSNLEAKLSKKEVRATLISYPWDLISNNPDAMTADFEFLGKKGVLGEFSELSTIYGGSKDDVYVAESAEVQPLVVLDVTHGPIFIDEEAVIFPHTRIEGPAYIGKDARIVGGKIREGTSIGPVCRVGGEVEEAIIHGYSNKYHDGFLGHAYVGEWVNLGALTTNSDLKNDYTTVEV